MVWDQMGWVAEDWEDARDHFSMVEWAQKMANYALNYGETNGSRHICPTSRLHISFSPFLASTV